jgi:hypothetical protein
MDWQTAMSEREKFKEWWSEGMGKEASVGTQFNCWQAWQAARAPLLERLDMAERALLSKGYRRSCDIPACNCGDQWNHGGHASERLREIREALEPNNGETLLDCAKRLRAQVEGLTNKCALLAASWKKAEDELEKIRAAQPKTSR